MATLRKNKRSGYTVIDNTVFMDYSISYKAKGLLCQMLSLPDGWNFSIEGLAKLSADGRTSVANALNELQGAGYFRRERVRDGNRISGIEYVISEVKFADFQKAENLHLENLRAEKHQQLNTNKSNTKRSNTNLHTYKDQRPTLEEVRGYIEAKKLNVDADRFYNYFEAGEWLDSKGNPVRNWKQKLITWSTNNGNDIRAGDKQFSRIRASNGNGSGGKEQVATGFIPMAGGYDGYD